MTIRFKPLKLFEVFPLRWGPTPTLGVVFWGWDFDETAMVRLDYRKLREGRIISLRAIVTHMEANLIQIIFFGISGVGFVVWSSCLESRIATCTDEMAHTKF